ncbi:RNA 2'-phosphotransferase [Myxococcota bacterium]|nr:RNA 2'-phosphotransferase [Myxococcota bacterium]
MSRPTPNLTDVSRAASHALRHEPWIYELELDADGWTDVDALLRALRDKGGPWAQLERTHLEQMIRGSEKQRHELVGDRIRALYGHSTPDRLQRVPSPPPSVLLHGTSPDVLETILADGLRPMSRQFVHLSVDEETARSVGQRKHRSPVLLRVSAHEAHEGGVPFYLGNGKVWLADYVPAAFLQVTQWSK